MKTLFSLVALAALTSTQAFAGPVVSEDLTVSTQNAPLVGNTTGIDAVVAGTIGILLILAATSDSGSH